jgi:hypothetical protein
MTDVCKLCQETRKLLDSHVFPKFAMRWMKKTGTGYLRFIKQPNVREQDGPTDKLLCFECEQRFSRNENYFASEVFHPFVETSKFSFAYDDRLIQFLVSLLWRILHRNLEEARSETDPFLAEILAAEREWRLFLLGQQPLTCFAHIHLFVPDLADESPLDVPYFNTYCTRVVDGVIITDSSPRFVYAKIGRFMCVGLLSRYEEQDWIGTRVNNGTGNLAAPQSIRDLTFGEFLMARARATFKRFESGLSDKQSGIIAARIREASKKVASSHLGDALRADRANQLRYASLKDKVGRNEPCPCGSGLNFMKCHGADP